jgi:hypothetical protein
MSNVFQAEIIREGRTFNCEIRFEDGQYRAYVDGCWYGGGKRIATAQKAVEKRIAFLLSQKEATPLSGAEMEARAAYAELKRRASLPWNK